MKTKQTIIGIISGVAIGTALGVLFAPDKGYKTRKKIIKKSTDATDNLKDKANSIMKASTEKHNSLLNKGKETIEKELSDTQIRNIQSINKVLGN